MIKWTITAPDGRLFVDFAPTTGSGYLHQILARHGLSGSDKGIKIEWSRA
jgi:hypothetical protein